MINTAYFLAFIFILFRLSSFFMVVPIFFPSGTPNSGKVIFSIIIAFILVPTIDYSSVGTINSNFDIIIFCFNEVITGLILGYITRLCFEFVRMAGQIMDFQVGFSMSQMFDPIGNVSSTLLGRTMFLFSVMLFLVIDGHHMLIRALVSSFDVMNLGRFVFSDNTFAFVLSVFVNFFEIGVKISIPIMLIILITNLTLALVARSVPQINVMILGLPIKIFIGLISLTLALPMISKMLGAMFDQIPYIIENLFKTVPLLIIFADGEKTEEATPKKLSEAKRKGQVAKSKELGLALSLITVTLLMLTLGDYLFANLKDIVLLFFNNYLNTTLDYNTVKGIFLLALFRGSMIFLPIAVPIMIVGIGINYAQTGFIFTTEPLKPDFKKLNPLSGFKKLFSVRSLVGLVKNLAMISVVGYIGYKFIIDNYGDIINMGSLRLEAVPYYLKKLVVDIFFRISLIMLIISVTDYVYQKRQFKKDMKMSKQEIKEEYKQMEGDPQIKAKIKEKQRQMAANRMMQSVPDASVVVTNPTHIAVALKYTEGSEEAPKVIAKGSDNIAIKIKEIAKENEVPIIENKPLARLIYSEVEIDDEIPAEMYQAVAEILALVYKLGKRGS